MKRDVDRKSDATIDRETAGVWAKRAIDCYQRFKETKDVKWLIRAEHFRHEAMEHAGTAGDLGKTLVRIERKIDKKRGHLHRYQRSQ